MKIFDYEGSSWDNNKTYNGVNSGVGNESEHFGETLSLSKNRIVIGASRLNKEDGKIFIADIENVETFIIPGAEGDGDKYGWSVAISDDGNVFAVGSILYECPLANSAPTFCGQTQVYNFINRDEISSNLVGRNDGNVQCGRSVDLNADGSTLIVGCRGEGFVASLNDIDGNYQVQKSYRSEATSMDDLFGSSVAISNDHQAVVIGTPGIKDESTFNNVIGSVHAFGNPDNASSSPSSIPSSSPSSSLSVNPSKSPSLLPSSPPMPSPTFTSTPPTAFPLSIIFSPSPTPTSILLVYPTVPPTNSPATSPPTSVYPTVPPTNSPDTSPPTSDYPTPYPSNKPHISITFGGKGKGSKRSKAAKRNKGDKGNKGGKWGKSSNIKKTTKQVKGKGMKVSK